jgi:tRNA A58 N-methylase Trm61
MLDKSLTCTYEYEDAVLAQIKQSTGVPKTDDLTGMVAVQTLDEILNSRFIAKAISVAVQLGIPDHLASAPVKIAELARLTETNEQALHRLLRVLALFDLFELHSDGTVCNCETANLLCDRPDSFYPRVRWEDSQALSTAWDNLEYSVRTGKPSFEAQMGDKFFNYLEQNPQVGTLFGGAFNTITAMDVKAIIEHYDFSGCRNIIDVGGGQGKMIDAIVTRYNNSVTGTVFDRPDVIAQAETNLSHHKDRVKVISGDFFEDIPTGGDTYILKHVLHDWDDERCKVILDNCRKAMNKGGKIVIMDAVMSNKMQSAMAKIMDLHMLVLLDGGRERSEADFVQLFKRSQLKLQSIKPTQGLVTIMEVVCE